MEYKQGETKQFPCYNPTLETTTHQQAVTHKHNEPRIWCLLLQVCLHRKNNLCFRVHPVSAGRREVPVSRGVAHAWWATHAASRLFSREQSWAGRWTTANGRRQLQQCHLETTFSGLSWVKFESQKKKFKKKNWERNRIVRWCTSTIIHMCIGRLEQTSQSPDYH